MDVQQLGSSLGLAKLGTGKFGVASRFFSVTCVGTLVLIRRLLVCMYGGVGQE